MNSIMTYGIIAVVLLVLELVYLKIADHFNIIDKPNERSSHSTIVLRGGGIIFLMAVWIWFVVFAGQGAIANWPFMVGLTMVAGLSFVDDIHSLPDSIRLVAQFIAMGLMFWNIGMINADLWWMVLPALIVCVGVTNIINFMDGINGITGSYALSSLVPLALTAEEGSVDKSLTMVMILATVVFLLFNFRPRGKAKCFAGDVGSIGIAFVLLFLIGKRVMVDLDITWLVFWVIYGLDGVITICHRIMLHENLGEAHRKHVYQLMVNELKMNHMMVSLIFALTQLAINLVFEYFVPDTVLAHWCYLLGVIVIFGVAFLMFRKKYYHLHEEYLASLKK